MADDEDTPLAAAGDATRTAAGGQEDTRAESDVPPPAGLHPGKALKETFRHPTKRFIMLPEGTLLNEEIIAGIRLMGAEPQAILCLGEALPGDLPLEPDVLDTGPVAMQKIDRESRILRQTRDILALFMMLVGIFALSGRFPVLVLLAVLTGMAAIILHVLAMVASSRVAAIVESINAAHHRRAQGERLIQEAVARLGLLKQG